jgi:hypothetical protein
MRAGGTYIHTRPRGHVETKPQREREGEMHACRGHIHTCIHGSAGMSRPNHREREREGEIHACRGHTHTYIQGSAGTTDADEACIVP